MQDLFAYLNANSGTLNVLFSGVVTIATAVYAVLTWRLVRETRMMRRGQTEPLLDVALESYEYAINLVRIHIRNIGVGPAKNVRFRLRARSGGAVAEGLVADFCRSNFLMTGLAHLGPGRQRWSLYTNIHENGDAKLDCVLSIEVEYDSGTGEHTSQTFTLDLSELKGEYQLGTPPMQVAARALEKMERRLSDVVTGFHRLKVDVFNEDDRVAVRRQVQIQSGRRFPIRKVAKRAAARR